MVASVVGAISGTVYWVSAGVLLSIGIAQMGIGDIDIKELGMALLVYTFFQFVSLGFLVVNGEVFFATVVTAFAFATFILGMGFYFGGTSQHILNHVLWFTGAFFVGMAYHAYTLEMLVLSAMLAILVGVTWFIPLGFFTGNSKYGFAGGVLAFVDAWLFLMYAYCNVAGITVP